MTCELTGAKTYDRLVGYCSVNEVDFGRFMMQNSSCKVWKNMMSGIGINLFLKLILINFSDPPVLETQSKRLLKIYFKASAPSGDLVTVILPPCASIICRQINNPKPEELSTVASPLLDV